MTLAERFWCKASVKSTAECWDWKACKLPSGYGLIQVNEKLQLAHRIAWQITHGEIPPGLVICHKCDRPSCVNPSHLFLGTMKDNQSDMASKGRSAHGERNAHAKLSQLDIATIRNRYKRGSKTDGLSQIAVTYGVSFQLISLIVNKKIWRHEPPTT
jgi:hypothetical protein